MTIIVATQVGANKNTARIWLQGDYLTRGGFEVNTEYKRSTLDGKIILTIDHNTGTHRVSRKARTGQPVIDILNKMVGDLYEVGTKIKAVIRRGKIVIRRATQSVKTYAREARVLGRLLRGEPLNVASLFHGGGILSKAIHMGLAAAGIQSTTVFASELEGRYLDASLSANPELFTERTILAVGPLEDVDLPEKATADILEAGIPCTGASLSGRSKGKLEHAESHEAAGAMFFATLQWIQRLQPAISILENVPAYQNTASMAVIRSMLKNWGYELCEMVLNGCEYGALENRNRLVVVAVSSGLYELMDGFEVAPLKVKPATLAEALEPIGEDDNLWDKYEHLVTKEARDIKAGKGFRRQLVTGDSETVPTITRQYQKGRSTDPFLRHPSNPDLSRLFTPVEHARIKGVPAGYIEATGTPKTIAHEILGQSIVFPVFEAVGFSIAQALHRACPAPTSVPEPSYIAAA
ncbi:DNA cytosine methyltransferase [Marinobacter halodurans]|nr:DNA cytosine methyltransferase [Marinobacter halodurans]